MTSNKAFCRRKNKWIDSALKQIYFSESVENNASTLFQFITQITFNALHNVLVKIDVGKYCGLCPSMIKNSSLFI